MSQSLPPDGRAVLIVYPFCLDHVGHGNIQRILAIARFLTASGFTVDLVYQGATTTQKVEAQYAGFRRVFAVEGGAPSSADEECTRRLTAFYGCHELPPANMRPSAPLTMLVRSLIEGESYHAVVATYAFTAPIFEGIGRRVLTVCDVQDVMHEHADACRQTTGQASAFTMPQATEEFLWRHWDVLVAITPEDEARIRRDLLPHQYLLTARHAAGACAPVAAPGADDVAFYAGSSNQSNVQSVTWLLEDVWPLVLQVRPSARLRLAGLICAALPERLRRTPGVEFLGFQEDLTAEIAGCGVLVAPYLYGSGLKIKVVEAACAGKAVVTTSAGLRGTGLESGRAIEVHDDPAAYARAVAGLLGDRQRRNALAGIARDQAAAVFSDTACYEPLATAIRLLGTAAAAPAAYATAAGALERIRLVVGHTRPERLILWGNGTHTRGLVPALAGIDVAVDLIVDARASAPGTSPEGLPVVPATQLAHAPGDLVVLSSETFETEMWRDLAPYRHAGGYVLGLCRTDLISRALMDRLSRPILLQIGIAPLEATRDDRTRAVVLWDSGATPARWTRVCAQRDLAAAIAADGASVIVVTPTSLAPHLPLAGMPADAQVLPLLDLHGESADARDVEGAARGLARASDVMARTSTNVVARLHLGSDDVLVVREPSLSECFGWAQTLRGLGTRCPAVVLWASVPAPAPPHVPENDHRAYWRLAVGSLADSVDGRLTVVPPAADVREHLRRSVNAVDREPQHLETSSMPHIPELLTALAALPSDWHGAGCLEMPNLEALARHASARRIQRSVETGAGKSTLLLSHLSERHLVFALDAGQSLTRAANDALLRRDRVEFIDGPSQHTLMRHDFTEPLQLVFIDGPHGFPFPNMEYWKLYPHIEAGGLLVIDDIHIPTIRQLFDFLREDAMFTLLETVGKTAFFERTTAETFSPVEDGWWLQNYNTRRFPVPYENVTSWGDDWTQGLGTGQRENDPAVYRNRLLPLIERWSNARQRVAIFGVGGHTDHLFSVVPELARLNIVAYLDTNPARQTAAYRDVPVQPLEWAPGHVDLVLCSSFAHELTQLQLLDTIPVKAVLSHPVSRAQSASLEAGDGAGEARKVA